MDRQKIEAFLGRFVEIASGASTLGLLAVADRSGLSSYLGQSGGGTSTQIAEGAKLDERYVREILSGLAAARVVEYDPDSETFTLPPEHALFLADTESPYFMGGWMDMIPAMFRQIDGVATATVHGGGVGFEEFGDEIIRGIDRGNAPSQQAFLIRKWLPGVPGLVERLESGIRVADIGCGSGTVPRLIGQAYPESQVFGYDASEKSIAVARSRTEDLSNVEFHAYSAREIPNEPGFDLIMTFDVVHDLAEPEGAMRHIKEALRPEGWYLLMEPNASSSLEGNLNDIGALLYGTSTLHCMTQSLAKGGAGLGAAWGRETTEELVRRAGFTSFEYLDEISNRFSAFYLVRH
jgi:SAM-dependent methyltransferase